MITPKEASKSLMIPSSTLRRWSKEFQDHLSPHTPGDHRSYTTTDLDTLIKIKSFLDEGLRYADIHKKLNAIEKPSEQQSALMLIGEFTQAIQDQQALIQALNNKIEKQDERIDHLEDWITTPWIKKIFKNPPGKKE